MRCYINVSGDTILQTVQEWWRRHSVGRPYRSIRSAISRNRQNAFTSCI